MPLPKEYFWIDSKRAQRGLPLLNEDAFRRGEFDEEDADDPMVRAALKSLLSQQPTTGQTAVFPSNATTQAATVEPGNGGFGQYITETLSPVRRGKYGERMGRPDVPEFSKTRMERTGEGDGMLTPARLREQPEPTGGSRDVPMLERVGSLGQIGLGAAALGGLAAVPVAGPVLAAGVGGGLAVHRILSVLGALKGGDVGGEFEPVADIGGLAAGVKGFQAGRGMARRVGPGGSVDVPREVALGRLAEAEAGRTAAGEANMEAAEAARIRQYGHRGRAAMDSRMGAWAEKEILQDRRVRDIGEVMAAMERIKNKTATADDIALVRDHNIAAAEDLQTRNYWERKRAGWKPEEEGARRQEAPPGPDPMEELRRATEAFTRARERRGPTGLATVARPVMPEGDAGQQGIDFEARGLPVDRLGLPPSAGSRILRVLERLRSVPPSSQKPSIEMGLGPIAEVVAPIPKQADLVDLAPEAPEVAAPSPRTPPPELVKAAALSGDIRPPASPREPWMVRSVTETEKFLPLRLEEYVVDVRDLKLDAKTYQYRRGASETGETGTFAGERRFRPEISNQLILHRRLDGTLYVADGHQRYWIAMRHWQDTGKSPPLTARILDEADGWTPQEVRAQTAMKNVANSPSYEDPLDGAVVLRNSPVDVTSGLNMSITKQRQAAAISGLSEDAYMMALEGRVAPNHAALVAGIPEPAQKSAMLALEKYGPESEVEAAALVADVARHGLRVTGQSGEIAGQGTLIPKEEVEALLPYRAKLVAYLDRALTGDRRLAALAEEKAGRLETLGQTRIDVAAAKGQKEHAERSRKALIREATVAGPIDSAITAGAERIRRGEDQRGVAEGLLDAVRAYLEDPAGVWADWERSAGGGGAGQEPAAGGLPGGRPAGGQLPAGGGLTFKPESYTPVGEGVSLAGRGQMTGQEKLFSTPVGGQQTLADVTALDRRVAAMPEEPPYLVGPDESIRLNRPTTEDLIAKLAKTVGQRAEAGPSAAVKPEDLTVTLAKKQATAARRKPRARKKKE